MEDSGETRKEDLLEMERCNLEIRRNFFAVRVAEAWNKLPEGVKKMRTTNGFENAYDV